jgi:zinc-binding alcohol dehydrogenase family protein
MKAVGYLRSLPVADADSLFDFDAPLPQPLPRDLLVRVEAISVNPLDAHYRKRQASPDGKPVILGWDAAGRVDAVGEQVGLFAPGDAVYFSGDLNRQGSNAEYVLVDERVVARKPESLDFTQAAALPLATITAWSALFDRLRVDTSRRPDGDAILLMGAAGGVGSMAVQLLAARTSLRIVATASRPESRDWLAALGTHLVLDHSRSISAQLREAGIPKVRYAFPLAGTLEHWPEIIASLDYEGEVAVVDNPKGLDVTRLRALGGGIHMTNMWVKLQRGDGHIQEVGALLAETATLVDAGRIRSTATADYGPICAANLRRAHQAIEQGRTIGKITLTGF